MNRGKNGSRPFVIKERLLDCVLPIRVLTIMRRHTVEYDVLEESFRNMGGSDPIHAHSFKILFESCERYMKVARSLMYERNFRMGERDYYVALVDLVREASVVGYGPFKKRIALNCAYVFPSVKETKGSTTPRILAGHYGKCFRNVIRMLRSSGNCEAQAAFAMALNSTLRALNPNDLKSMAMSSDDRKIRTLPSVDPFYGNLLKASIDDVVQQVYNDRKVYQPDMLRQPPMRASVDTTRKQGSTSAIFEKEYGILYPYKDLYTMTYTPREGVRTHYASYPTYFDLIADYTPVIDSRKKVLEIVDKGKIRTVTVNSPDNNLLVHTFQKTLFNGVWSHPVFAYTKCEIHREPQHCMRLVDSPLAVSAGSYFDMYISGDYKGATDKIAREFTSYTLFAIFSHFGMMDFDKILKSFNHDLDFVLGQPQGHGLSFAILCIINAALALLTYRLVLNMPGLQLSDIPVLINGDDIVMSGNIAIYNKWMEIVRLIGMEVNVTKTFVSKTHFTLNSRAFHIEKDVIPTQCRMLSMLLPDPVYKLAMVDEKPQPARRKRLDETLSSMSNRLNCYLYGNNHSFVGDAAKRSVTTWLRANGLLKSQQSPISLWVAPANGGLGLMHKKLRIFHGPEKALHLVRPCSVPFFPFTRKQAALVREYEILKQNIDPSLDYDYGLETEEVSPLSYRKVCSNQLHAPRLHPRGECPYWPVRSSNLICYWSPYINRDHSSATERVINSVRGSQNQSLSEFTIRWILDSTAHAVSAESKTWSEVPVSPISWIQKMFDGARKRTSWNKISLKRDYVVHDVSLEPDIIHRTWLCPKNIESYYSSYEDVLDPHKYFLLNFLSLNYL